MYIARSKHARSKAIRTIHRASVCYASPGRPSRVSAAIAPRSTAQAGYLTGSCSDRPSRTWRDQRRNNAPARWGASRSTPIAAGLQQWHQRPYMITQHEFCCARRTPPSARALRSAVSGRGCGRGETHLLGRLVEHLALRRERVRAVDQVVDLLAPL